MGATSIWHWIILLLIVVLLFGRGKISEIMGDVAKGIKSFKKGMSEEEEAKKKEEEARKTGDGLDAKIIEHVSPKTSDATAATDKSKVG